MNKKQSLFHIAKRDTLPWYKSFAIRGCAILLALVVCAVVTMLLTGENPVNIFATIFKGAFGSARKSWVTFQNLAVLLGISLAVTPAFKMRFWNIGAEGQVLAGGIATAACMIYLGGKLPTPVLFLVMVLASVAAGALWGFIPALFKAKWGTNETLFTLMMNYIAIQITSYCVALWENPYGSNKVGIINPQTKAGWFPKLFGQQYTWNVLIVLALTVLVFLYLKYSKQGYEIAVVGESENTARYAGINVRHVILRTMLISGAVCGIAGFIGVAGVDHTISTNTAGGRGFTAIIIAWLAKFNTITMVIITSLIVFLNQGAGQIVSDFSKLGINDYVAEIIKGIILFFILGSEFFVNYRLIFRGSTKTNG